jgi:bifunctional UDP-N-acetylglucosamine pyrophosphorylase/glucosamine-1-phosphate N-acetyltransferase
MSNPETPKFGSRTCLAIVLAAGEGARMRSARPKVLHEIAGRSMLAHTLDAVWQAGASAIAVVIGPDQPDVEAEARRAGVDYEIFVQSQRLGTAHAVLAARGAIARGFDDILVAYADIPLLRPATISALREDLARGSAVVALAFEPENPSGYGRLVERDGVLIAIREHKDASEAEREIRICNAGPMAIDGQKALDLLDQVGADNAQREFYLTDLVAIAAVHALPTSAGMASEGEVMGVNDRVQLAAAEAEMQRRLRHRAMSEGATLIAPETVFLSYDTKIGRDALIEPHVVFGRGVSIADGATIHAFSHLEGSVVATGASIGPFARLRPDADIGPGAKIGNFVEIKKARVEAGAKVNHLSYIGDATIGAGANIGAGTITCNYDGVSKHRTTIGAGAFIGSNSALVAPVAIGAGAFVGSGSVITEDVEHDALALARARQIAKPGWAKAFRSKEKSAKASLK